MTQFTKNGTMITTTPGTGAMIEQPDFYVSLSKETLDMIFAMQGRAVPTPAPAPEPDLALAYAEEHAGEIEHNAISPSTGFDLGTFIKDMAQDQARMIAEIYRKQP